MSTEEKPLLLPSLLTHKCPRCRRGELYKVKGSFRIKHLMEMNESCAVCHQPFDMEPGFYYGTNMISYVLAVFVSAASLLLWIITIGVSLQDHRFFWWIGCNALLLLVLQPPLMRLSRTIWLAFFVHYNAQWSSGNIVQPERINKQQMNNW